MVLFKRKPVQYEPQPEVTNPDQEVWLIRPTGECFVEYEAYLTRMDHYKQRKFICQITGHSGLTFFDALKSELAGAQEVEEAFPEALKGPILRRVQFQTISRIDTLVDLIYEEYRSDYYPGEAVTVHVITGERLTGVVRDKTRFGGKVLPDGSSSQPFCRYFVSLDNRPMEEAVVDDAHISRDRKIFTKQVLRSFIKKTVTRDAWTGAPWLVKPEVANQYHIDTKVPYHLRYETKAAERKQNQAQKKTGPDYEGMVGSFNGNVAQGGRLPELKPAVKSHKSKQQQKQLSQSKHQPFLNSGPPPNSIAPPHYKSHKFIPHPSSFVSHTSQASGALPPQSMESYPNYQNQPMGFAPLASIAPPPPPPPIKYPIEDLQVPPRLNALSRPPLKYFSQDTPFVPFIEEAKNSDNGINMSSIGPLLETWDILNVYCEKFALDSFTLDDFVEALHFSSPDVDCELFVEVHCAVLKLLVDSEGAGGKVQVRLPEMDIVDDDDDSTIDATNKTSPTPEPEPKPKGRATRSSLAKAEAEALKEEPEATNGEPKKTNRAAEVVASIDWIDRLRKRDFKNGGWQVIMVGLLHQLQKNPRHFEPCEALLVQLAPNNIEPTQESVRLRYAKLDINLRISALQIICQLTVETKTIRSYMEEGAEIMTGYRKEKIVFQRDRKQAMEELKLLKEEYKVQLPANLPPSQDGQPAVEVIKTPEPQAHVDSDEDMIDVEDEVVKGRGLRRNNDRAAADRKRKREAEQAKKEKAAADAKVPKHTKQFTKLLRDISKAESKIQECEDEIAVLDNDLREADCPRTRVLGKDRFWNRYYWFERNGMPYGGLPDSSTAEAGYANGLLWVQGPDDIEREGYIEMKPEWQAEYQQKFGITVPERKRNEEGQTMVFTAHQWGYYDQPESVDALIQWLDMRGFNEVKLLKELRLYRERIIRNMNKRKAYLNPADSDSVESGKRMTTRQIHKHSDQTVHRCLDWHNTTAVREFGHLHSDQPRTRKSAKKAAAAPVVDDDVRTRGDAKGKKRKTAA